jgi:exopolysaccharide production protein ExoQ
MPSFVAAAVFLAGMAGLFWADHDKNARTSPALWIPLLWVGIACSRPISSWMSGSVGSGAATAEKVLEGSPTDRLFFTLLLVVGIVVLFSRGRQAGTLLRSNGVMVFYFFYGALSIAWSDFPDVSFKRWFKAVGDLVMIMIVLSDRDPSAAIRRFFARLTFILIPLSMLFIKYYPNTGTIFGPWGGRMVAGVTTNKNALGVICLLFGLGILWEFLEVYKDRKAEGRKRRLIAYGAAVALVIWLLQIANSMTSTSCFAMGTVILLAANFQAVVRRPRLLHFLIATMIGVSAAVAFLGVSPGALEAMGRNPTLTDRTEVWGWLFSLVRNPFIGTGFESFWLGPRLEKLWDIYWWHPNEAHNGYIEIYLNLGWIGIILMGVVLVAAYRRIISAYRHHLPMASLCLAYFLVGVTYNFTEAAFFRMLAPAWIFFILAVVSLPAISSYRRQPLAQKALQVPTAYGNGSAAESMVPGIQSR